MANRTNDDDIDYRAEGETPPHEKDDPTNQGYDEAAHSGPSRYGVPEGNGGVFGTTGGGTFQGGMHVEDETEERNAGVPPAGPPPSRRRPRN